MDLYLQNNTSIFINNELFTKLQSQSNSYHNIFSGMALMAIILNHKCQYTLHKVYINIISIVI